MQYNYVILSRRCLCGVSKDVRSIIRTCFDDEAPPIVSAGLLLNMT